MTTDNHLPRHSTPLLALTHAVARLAGARSPDEVVEVIRTTVRAMIGSEGVSIIRRDGAYCHYIEEDAIGPLWKGQKFPASVCVSGWAMLEKRTVVIPDIREDVRITREFYDPTFVRAMAMTPIRTEDPIGAIGVYWSRPYDPTPAEMEILEALASAAATAIENVRLIAALSDALQSAELARDELKHRVKNAYMGVQSLARVTLAPEHADGLIDRIGALATAHAFLDDRVSGSADVGLQQLIEIEIEPYVTQHEGRINMHGPVLTISRAHAILLGLAVNELATNALKHGALSVPEGVVDISWHATEAGMSLHWRESNGPQVTSGPLAGEGAGLLRRLVEDQLKGQLGHALEAAGVECTISFPFARANSQASLRT